MASGIAATSVEALSNCQVILIAVPDAALAQVVERLATADLQLKKIVVLQTSRLYDSGALERLRRRGAAVGSLQPLFVLRRPVPSLAGVYCAVEGDPTATRMARKMIRSWNGEFQLVRAEQKIHLSIACSIAADFLPGLLEMIVQQFSRAGFLKKRSLRAISHVIEATFQEYSRSGRRARAGPLLRNESDTVERYLAQLSRADPAMAEAYRQTARQTLAVLRRMHDDFGFLDHPSAAGRRAMGAAAGGGSK
jgi:predicted short-subunit dehydrogenase-like oxidoreductase (DUF2520 family)